MASSGTAEVTLPADDQILITREFDAPKAPRLQGVHDARAGQALVDAKRGKATIAEIDLRVGGKWRYVMVTEDGIEVAFHGEYREVVPNERLVTTEVYEGAPPEAQAAGDAVNTVTFTETDGRTTLEILMQAPSKEIRDAILESGMEAGLQDALELLEDVASSLR